MHCEHSVSQDSFLVEQRIAVIQFSLLASQLAVLQISSGIRTLWYREN